MLSSEWWLLTTGGGVVDRYVVQTGTARCGSVDSPSARRNGTIYRTIVHVKATTSVCNTPSHYICQNDSYAMSDWQVCHVRWLTGGWRVVEGAVHQNGVGGRLSHEDTSGIYNASGIMMAGCRSNLTRSRCRRTVDWMLTQNRFRDTSRLLAVLWIFLRIWYRMYRHMISWIIASTADTCQSDTFWHSTSNIIHVTLTVHYTIVDPH